MEDASAEDTSWLALLGSLDGFDTSEELLRTVLSNAPSQQSPLPPPVLAVPAKNRSLKPKDEIKRLRQVVMELEAARDAVRPRLRPQPPRRTDAHGSRAQTVDAVDVWKRVAQRQLEYLRASRAANQQLRGQVEEHLALVKRLARLVMRARRGLPAHQGPASLPPPDVGAECAAMRQELITMAAQLYHSVDAMLLADRARGEFQDLTVVPRGPNAFAPGAKLATTCVARLAPRPLAMLSDLLWEHDYSNLPETFKIQHAEQSAYCQVIHYGIDHMMDEGLARYHGVGLRIRVHEAARDVILDAGAMWPDAKTPPPWNAISYVLKEAAVVEPLELPDMDTTEEGLYHQVRIKFETFRHAPVPTNAKMKPHEATLLQDAVLQSHHFILDHHNRRLDGLLLSQHATVAS